MAKKTVKKATKEPKGSITRDKLKFTASWKIADADYKDGQQWTRRVSYSVATAETNMTGASVAFTEASGDEITEPIGTSVTKKVVSIAASDYYPNTKKRLTGISVKVRGKRKTHETSKTKYVYTWSKWSEFVFAINAPKNPVFSAKPAELYQDDDRRSHFIVSATAVDDKNRTPVSRLQWESILVKNASTTDGSKQKWDKTVTGWRTGTTNTLSNYEVPIPTETIVPTNLDSYTRFVRVRAQGVGGDSAWVYNWHVYGKAYTPQVTEGDVGVGDGTLVIDADWTTPSDPSHPVDKITLQYCVTEPAAGLTCPASASWTDAQVTGDTKAIDKAFYEVGQGLEDDQCLFYRVTAVHDNETTHSDPVLKYVGYLKQPTGLSAQINWQTKRATVTATNTSGVVDSFLAIYTNIGGYHCIGYIPHGQTSATVEIPDFANENNFAIGVRAVVGMWQNGLKPYAGKPLMESRNTLWQGGSVPKAPTNVTVEKTSVSGTVSVSWDWAWEDADSAQIAWSDNPLAWESTDEPSDYTITNLNPSHWYVSELATGQTWYFRVRLLQTNDDVITYGAWSDMVSIDLSSAPNRPTLFLSDGVISADGMTKAFWAYVSTDDTPQAYAEICEATIDGGGITYGEPILHTESEQHIDIYPNELGWSEGEVRYLCVRVVSASGMVSEGWSEPVPLQIAAEMTCHIADTSLVEEEEGDCLTQLPLAVTVTGAGDGGTTILVIERDGDYPMRRPDEAEYTGHDGETIALLTQSGEEEMTVDLPSLIGYLDDGARYRIVATTKDAFGQTATDSLDFLVKWDEQAIIPDGVVEIDGNIAKLTPIAPSGVTDGAVCDIYRLSADRPELVYPNAEFGQTYIDPYPAIGGGYRFVYKTKYGDYITEDDTLAWLDVESEYDHDRMIVDFGGDSAELYYNVDEDDDWSKDFQSTQYLGGHIVGDWNPAVERAADISAVVITIIEEDTVDALRRLAEYAGACHVRTLSGSSYTANVDVKRSKSHDHYGTRYSYGLKISKVDSQGYDGMPEDLYEVIS